MTLTEHIARSIARSMEPFMRKAYPEPFWPNEDMYVAYFWGQFVPAAERVIEEYRDWQERHNEAA